MGTSHTKIKCACCGESGIHRARGLITACYLRKRRQGTLDQWDASRSLMPSEKRYALLLRYRAKGMSDRQAAMAMGLHPSSIEKMLWHRRQRGLSTDDLRPERYRSYLKKS